MLKNTCEQLEAQLETGQTPMMNFFANTVTSVWSFTIFAKGTIIDP